MASTFIKLPVSGGGGGGAGVSSFNGRTGSVSPQAGDYNGGQVTNTPAGNIAATTVQAALNELDSEKQPLDSTLTSLAAYNTNGILTQTAADTFTGRTITGTYPNITVTNGNGVSGNPTINLTNTAVSAGTYNTPATIVVDAKGRLTGITADYNAFLDRNQFYYLYTDFVQGSGAAISDSLSFTSTNTGDGSLSVSTTGVDSTMQALGVVQIASGTTTAASASMMSSSNRLLAGWAEMTCRGRMWLDSVGTVTDTYQFTYGFMDTTGVTVDHVDGAYFRFNGDGVNTFYECVTSNNSSRTSTTTTVSVVANQIQGFKIIINNTGTSCDFYIDGSLVATHTTNIPSSANRFFTMGGKMNKTLGTTTNYALFMDWCDLKLVWATPRTPAV